MKIAVTGICSMLGQVLAQKLAQDPRVKTIVGLDIAEYRGEVAKVQAITVDIRDRPRIIDALKGVDVVIHMACIVLPRPLPNKADIYSINIDGSRNVFDAAALNHIKKIIHISSSAVYGYFPENPKMVDELAPLRGRANTDFYYPHTKSLIEDYLDQFEMRHPDIDVTRLRAPMIVGPHFSQKGDLFQIKQGRVALITPANHEGKIPFQMVHEDDLTDIIVMAMGRPIRGAYNVAADSIPDLREYFTQKWQIKVAEIPRFAVKLAILLGRFLAIGLWAKCPLYPSLLDNRKIKKDFHWVPKHSVEHWLDHRCSEAAGLSIK